MRWNIRKFRDLAIAERVTRLGIKIWGLSALRSAEINIMFHVR
jgi:hypothetical protein